MTANEVFLVTAGESANAEVSEVPEKDALCGVCDPVTHDVIAVGCGPSNLSLAALATEVDGLDVAVLEAADSFEWHSGMMFPGAQLQVSPIKDLVSLVSPTNPFSFLNFVVSQGRIYRFLVSSRGGVTRREFEQYYAWAAQRVGSVRFGHRVLSARWDGTKFEVVTSQGSHFGRALVLGTGSVPRVPACARELLGPEVFHVSEYLNAPRDTSGRRVLVAGGGQSGAEVVKHLLSAPGELPGELTWLLGRDGVAPLDDSAFANDWFTPSAVRYFNERAVVERDRLLDVQRYASDGVSEDLAAQIYRRLYELDYLEPPGPDPFSYAVLPGARLSELSERGDGAYTARVSGPDAGSERKLCADIVVLATGFEQRLPSYVSAPLLVNDDGTPRARQDYRVSAGQCPVYVQNGARRSHGVADPNLSLSAWRSAVILNSVAGRQVFKTDGYSTALALESGQHENAQALLR
jgi:lysine N6-hydroxylase